LLHSSCWDANAGLFQALMVEEDVIISDELNHASIIDGIRLSRAESKVYKHADMNDLERNLKDSKKYRMRMIASDGVFSMDGDYAPLGRICDLAEKYDAIVMIDDSHATGFVGENGRGTHEKFGVFDRVDIITSTFGKALGGASGGFICGSQPIIDYLRMTSRPFMFSNSVAPPIVQASLEAVELVSRSDNLRKTLMKNTQFFRKKIEESGFTVIESDHPIVPIILGEDKLAHDMARDLLSEGIFVIGMRYPVVPKGQARIRIQISAAHTQAHLDKAIEAFGVVGKRHGVIT
jgi:glycine C-acetyltransferase